MVSNRAITPKPHTVRLRGLRVPELGLSADAPTILRRQDDDPIAGVLADLLKPTLEEIKKTQITEFEDDPWRFFQPVHRVFHIVLLEAICDPFEAEIDKLQPRLDPLKIDSAGLVIRRYAIAPPEDEATATLKGVANLRADLQLGASANLRDTPQPTLSTNPKISRFNPLKAILPGSRKTSRQAELQASIRRRRLNQLEGWRTLKSPAADSNTKLRGWIPLLDTALNQDPDPQQQSLLPVATQPGARNARAPQIKTGRLELDRQLSLIQAVEATYSEQVSPVFVAPPEVCNKLGKTVLYALLPLTSQELSAAENLDQAFDLGFVESHLPEFLTATPADKVNADNNKQRRDRPNTDEYKEILRQLSDELELLKETLASSDNLVRALNRFKLYKGAEALPAGSELKAAAEQLSTDGTVPYLPAAWGVISTATGNAIARSVIAILNRRNRLAIPQLNRYDELDREYSLRAFIRVKSDHGCGPQLCWSEASQPFSIRRWYENTPLPPVQVALPDLIGEDLSTLTPNVAFAVPAGLFSAIDGMTLEDLLDGKKPSGGGPALDWICGFNIPIITICAFIVLNIFLQLLNFIFQWLPFIKICIPIPQTSQGGDTP